MERRLIERRGRFTNKLVYAYARTRSHLHAIVARLVIRWSPASISGHRFPLSYCQSSQNSLAIPIAFASIFQTIEFPHDPLDDRGAKKALEVE